MLNVQRKKIQHNCVVIDSVTKNSAWEGPWRTVVVMGPSRKISTLRHYATLGHICYDTVTMAPKDTSFRKIYVTIACDLFQLSVRTKKGNLGPADFTLMDRAWHLLGQMAV